MKKITRQIDINATPASVISVMLNIRDYPKMVPNINSVRILSMDDIKKRAKVEIVTKSSLVPTKMVSIQEIELDLDNLQMKFSQLSGMLKYFQGTRRVQDNGQTTMLISEVEYKMDRVLAGLFGKTLERMVAGNVENLLASIKSQAELIRTPPYTMNELLNHPDHTELLVV